MFFHAVRRHLEFAQEGWLPVENTMKGLKKLDEQWERLHADENVSLDRLPARRAVWDRSVQVRREG